jgi:hypothetical protein
MKEIQAATLGTSNKSPIFLPQWKATVVLYQEGGFLGEGFYWDG